MKLVVKQNSSFILPLFLLGFLLIPAEIKAKKQGSFSNKDLKKFVFNKLKYDESYFKKVLHFHKKGKNLRDLSSAQFNAQVERAKVNLPILKNFWSEKSKYLQKGKAFTRPRGDRFVVYSNLISILNMLSATEKNGYKKALSYGLKVKSKSRDQLGRTKDEKGDYYIKLYRQYFFLMANAYFHLGDDQNSLKWLSKIETDKNLQKLKKEIAAEGRKLKDSRSIRIATLKNKALAVIDFKNLNKKDKDNDWLKTGLSEILTADLSRYTDLFIIERSQLNKVINESALSMAGITQEKNLKDVGALLNSSSLLLGSYIKWKAKKLF